jgi:hypothetical protein
MLLKPPAFAALFFCLTMQANAAVPLPATLGYCGPAADTAALQALWLKSNYPADVTYIVEIAVIGTYGKVTFSGKGTATAFYRKRAGAWRHDRSNIYASWPPPVLAKFKALNVLPPARNGCENPRYIERSMG